MRSYGLTDRQLRRVVKQLVRAELEPREEPQQRYTERPRGIDHLAGVANGVITARIGDSPGIGFVQAKKFITGVAADYASPTPMLVSVLNFGQEIVSGEYVICHRHRESGQWAVFTDTLLSASESCKVKVSSDDTNCDYLEEKCKDHTGSYDSADDAIVLSETTESGADENVRWSISKSEIEDKIIPVVVVEWYGSLLPLTGIPGSYLDPTCTKKGLVGYWRMHEGGVAHSDDEPDRSVFGNDLTIGNGIDEVGHISKSRWSNSITIPLSVDMGTGQTPFTPECSEITIAAWIYHPSGTTIAADAFTGVSNAQAWGTSTSIYGFSTSQSATAGQISGAFNWEDQAGTRRTLSYGDLYEDDTWTFHVATMTHDGVSASTVRYRVYDTTGASLHDASNTTYTQRFDSSGGMGQHYVGQAIESTSAKHRTEALGIWMGALNDSAIDTLLNKGDGGILL